MTKPEIVTESPDGDGPSAAEKSLLDTELEEYQKNSDAGSSWEEVEARLLNCPNE